jgi:hypothetical protein
MEVQGLARGLERSEELKMADTFATAGLASTTGDNVNFEN